MSTTAAFWDTKYASSSYSRLANRDPIERALKHFGDIKGKNVLEIGCGPGASALLFAELGANVTAVDLSQKAIDDLTKHCAEAGIKNVTAICANAMEIASLPQMDFVVGFMILHHIEPFGDFSSALAKVLKKGGRAFFWENNATSSVLIWFRENVIGKLWIPKYGDPDEFPLMPKEVDELRKHFDVTIEYSEMRFFKLIGRYLFRRGSYGKVGTAVDNFLYRKRWFLRYSYVQDVLLTNR